MKKPAFEILAIFMLILFSYSCQKDQIGEKNDLSLNNPDVKLTLNDAKKYYKSLKEEQGNILEIKELAKMFPSDVNHKFVNFKKAYTSETQSVYFVEAPLMYNRKISTLIRDPDKTSNGISTDEVAVIQNTFDRLVIYKNKSTGEIAQRIVRYIPDLDYVKKHNFQISQNQINKLDSDFKGYLQYFDWSGNPELLLKIENGKIIKKRSYVSSASTTSSLKNLSSKKTASSAGGMTTQTTYCQGYVDITIITICYYTDPEGYYQNCDTYEEYGNYHEECWDEPELTGDPCIDYGQCDNPPPTPDPTTPTVDTKADHQLPKTDKLPPRSGGETQVLSTCVFKTMEWISKYYGGTNTVGSMINSYAQAIATTTLPYGQALTQTVSNGITGSQINTAVDLVFDTKTITSITSAINSGDPVMGTLTISPGNGHEVMITGYNNDGTIEYFDPETAKYGTKAASSFSLLIEITGIKK